MTEDTARQLASEAAARVWKLIGDLRYAKLPFNRFLGDIIAAREVLFDVLYLMNDDGGQPEIMQFYRPLSKAYYQLLHSQRKKAVLKKRVVMACDYLVPLLPKRR